MKATKAKFQRRSLPGIAVISLFACVGLATAQVNLTTSEIPLADLK